MKRLLSLTLTLAMLVTLGLGTAMSVSAKSLAVVQEEIFDEGDAESGGSGVSHTTTHGVSYGKSETAPFGGSSITTSTTTGQSYSTSTDGKDDDSGNVSHSESTGTLGIGTIEFGVANSSKQNATSGTSSDDKDDAGSATNSSLPGVIQFGGGASTDGDGYTHSTSKVNPDGSITTTTVTTGVATNSYNNGSLTRSQVKTLQKALGVTPDGYYGNASRAAAGGLSADAAYKKFVKNTATAVNRRAGDMNGDGKVNLSDCSQLLKLMQKPSSCTANDIKYGDLNHDGVLNYADYSRMLSLAKGK